MTQVTAIVVSYNSKTDLHACLTSVVEQREVPTDIVVVDNGSTDNSVDLVKTGFPSARLIINESNRGFAAAVNQGLALTKSSFVLLINPDAVLLPNALGRLIEFMEAYPRTGAAGPRQWLEKDCVWQWSVVLWPPHWRLVLSRLPGLRRLGLARRQLVPHWALNHAIWRSERPQEVRYLSGACLLLRRSALEAVDGLDEGYFLFFEDTDLCDRLRAAGWTLYVVPSAGAVHTMQGSVRHILDGGQRHLLSSGRRYLTRRGDPLTYALWVPLQWRRARLSGRQTRPIVHPGLSRDSVPTLHWSPTRDAVAYWVEVAFDPAFLYAATARVAQPVCTLPLGLWDLVQRRHFFWRVAPVDRSGQVGSFLSY